MRRITVSFARAIEWFAGDLCLHFLPLFQQVVTIRKTCNLLSVYRVRTQAQIRARLALDMWREAYAEGRRQTLAALHRARAG